MDGVNFSENLRIAALKLLKLTQFASPNLSIYFNFKQCWARCSEQELECSEQKVALTGQQKTEANHIILHYKNNTIFHNL